MSDTNITELPNIERDKQVAQLENLKRNIEVLIETNKLIAKVRRQSYLAYIAEGFSADQALSLCK
jgi:hypothetical protein